MMSCQELAKILEWGAVRAKNELEIPTEALMVILEEKAKDYLGTYQDGWAPLAESTIADKTAQGYPVPSPLLRTGDMRDSIEHRSEPTPEGAQGEIGSNDEVALWQEMGTSRGIPPRPFLALAMSRSEEPAIPIFGEFAQSLLLPR